MSDIFISSEKIREMYDVMIRHDSRGVALKPGEYLELSKITKQMEEAYKLQQQARAAVNEQAYQQAQQSFAPPPPPPPPPEQLEPCEYRGFAQRDETLDEIVNSILQEAAGRINHCVLSKLRAILS